MPLEIALFLAFLAALCVATLVLLYLSSARTATRLLLWTVLMGLPLIAACAYIGRRFSGDPRLLTGCLLIGVPYLLAFVAIDQLARRREGLIFPSGKICAFRESAVSGRSCESTLLRLGAARHCLQVTVTEDELWVDPRFPFSLLGRVWGLVHRVPLLRIHQMERLAGPRANIRLEYTGQDGWCRCVELHLRNPSAFIDAVREGQWEGVR